MVPPSTSTSQKRAADSPSSDQPDPKKSRVEETIAKSFLETIGTEMVDISVGKGAKMKHFHVHKTILCSKIPYFNKMFKGTFKEATESSACFPDDDASAFYTLLQWVYTGTLRPLVYSGYGTSYYQGSWDVAFMYVLVDKFCLFALRDIVVTEFIDWQSRQNRLPSPECLKNLYKRTARGSTLRKYAVHSLWYIMYKLRPTERNLRGWPTDKLQKVLTEDSEFLLDYLEFGRKYPRDKAAKDPRKISRCTFHHHGADEPCPVEAPSL